MLSDSGTDDFRMFAFLGHWRTLNFKLKLKIVNTTKRRCPKSLGANRTGNSNCEPPSDSSQWSGRPSLAGDQTGQSKASNRAFGVRPSPILYHLGPTLSHDSALASEKEVDSFKREKQREALRHQT